MPRSNSDYKFDLDFQDGLIAEGQLLRLFANCKVEVKNDYFIDKTGNIAIECKCWGKPSGISTTEADWFAIGLGNTDAEIFVFIKVTALKELVKTFYNLNGYKHGGDQNASRFVLIPWQEIINLSNYGTEQERWKNQRQK